MSVEARSADGQVKYCSFTVNVTAPPPPPPPAPKATLSLATLNQDSLYVGQAPNLNRSCTSVATSSSDIWPIGSNAGVTTAPGNALYGHTCSNASGSDTAWVVVTVLPTPGDNVRATRNRTEEVAPGMHLKFGYFTVCGGLDLHRDTDGTLETSIMSSMMYTAVQSNIIEKFDTHHGTHPDIMYHCMPLADALVSNATISDELQRLGFLADTTVRWVVYFEGVGYSLGCGDGAGQVAIMYLQACGGLYPTTDFRYWSGTEVGMIHETGHEAGFMDPSNPFRDPTSLFHSSIPTDLMATGSGPYIDLAENNYFSKSGLPTGVKNWYNDPIWIPTPSWMADMVVATKLAHASSSLRATPTSFNWVDKPLH